MYLMKPITELIPHRKPFLFVDRLEKVELDEIIGYKVFNSSEPFFNGHFPEHPVVPGVILIECMAQCGGAGISSLTTNSKSLAFLASIDSAKFRRQVVPGEEIKIVVTTNRNTPNALRQSGKIYVNKELAAEASWLCLKGR